MLFGDPQEEVGRRGVGSLGVQFSRPLVPGPYIHCVMSNHTRPGTPSTALLLSRTEVCTRIEAASLGSLVVTSLGRASLSLLSWSSHH